MNVEGYGMPDDLYYRKEHMWVKVKGNKVKVGLHDFSQKMAGEISYVETQFKCDDVSHDDKVGTVATGKWVGKIYAPGSGTVRAVNEDLMDDPALINSDPYGEGGIFEIEMKDSGGLNNLMKGNYAVEWMKSEIEKHAK